MPTEQPTADQVMKALTSEGTVAEAAKALGVSERTLYRRMKHFGINVRRVPVKGAA